MKGVGCACVFKDLGLFIPIHINKIRRLRIEHRDGGMPHQQKLGVSKWQDCSMHNLCAFPCVLIFFFSFM